MEALVYWSGYCKWMGNDFVVDALEAISFSLNWVKPDINVVAVIENEM